MSRHFFTDLFCKDSRPVLLVLLLIVGTAIAGCDNDPVAASAMQAPAGFSDVEGVKLQVGKPAPDFSLPSMDGRTVKLSEFRESAVMLIFYRGYWCPFCIGHMEDIQSILPELAQQGIQIIAISPDDVDELKIMAGMLDNPYLFLSDARLAVVDAYGIRRDEKLPHPAVVLVGKDGIVKWFYVGENYKQRPAASQISALVKRLDL